MHAKTTGKLAALAIVGFCGPAAADGIVATIKPLHSLVSFVTAGVAEPHLLIEGAASPHGFPLRPSDARALENARVIFRIDENFEATLSGPIRTLGSKARVVSLSRAPGMVLRPLRVDPAFEAHDHDHHAEADKHDDHDRHAEADKHDDHDRHAEADKHDDHDHHAEADKHDDHDRHTETDGDHGHDERRQHTAYDLHFWLDPANARAMAGAIVETMSAVDPANASVYAENGKTLVSRLDALTAEVGATLSTVRGKPFIVFHDAYQYFESRFGLTAAGAIAMTPERLPGAQRVAEIRARLRETAAACVFREPQFSSSLVDVVVEGTNARIGLLDPLGAAIEDGPELYFSLIRDMAASFRKCLG